MNSSSWRRRKQSDLVVAGLSSPLTFECFTRIGPPPLDFRGRSPGRTKPRFEIVQN